MSEMNSPKGNYKPVWYVLSLIGIVFIIITIVGFNSFTTLESVLGFGNNASNQNITDVDYISANYFVGDGSLLTNLSVNMTQLNDTLQSVTDRGSTTDNAITVDNRLYVNDRLGVGTTNPLSTLSVVHSGDVNSGGGIFLHNNQSTRTTGWRIVEGQPGNFDGFLMFLRQGASTPGNLYITPNGNVDLPTGASIGDNQRIASVSSGALAFWTPYVTTNPGYSLFSFRGNSNQAQAQYRIQGFYHDGSWNKVDLAYFYALPTNSRLRLFQNLEVNGDVGIGTSTPNQKLQVDGNINASGTVYASAFISHSPIRLGEDSLVGHTRLCYKATNGDVVLKEIQKIGSSYQEVYTKDTQGVCDKALIKQSSTESEIMLVDGTPKEVQTQTRTYETFYSKEKSTRIIKEVKEALPLWTIDNLYGEGERFQYLGEAYEVIQEHTSQQDWKPNEVPALYKKLILHEYNEITEWTQPQGSHDCYPLDAQVTFNGKTYQSNHDCNVWQPPTLWSEIQ